MTTDKLKTSHLPVEKRAIVVLAAGASMRMGSPKQLLPYKGKTLLQHVVDTARAAEVSLVVTVLGANAETILQQSGAGINPYVVNENWQEGMASSIQSGLKKVLELLPGLEAVVFLVGDQPFLSSTVIDELFVLMENTGAPIVACKYGSVVGVPALFHKTTFSALMELKGAEGAKQLIKEGGAKVMLLDFPQGAIDIDTQEDYLGLLK